VLGKCIKGAWKDYLGYPDHLRLQHTPRSRASLVHDHIVMRVRNAFDDFDDVRLHDINKLFVLVLPGEVVIRFKKLNDNLRSSGIPTQQRLEFAAQGDLPGIESVTHLEAGYTLNEFETAIDGVHVVCPYNDSVLWAHEIFVEDDDQAKVVALPAGPTSPASGGGQVSLVEGTNRDDKADGGS
jgi:hypothetical protein